MYSVLAKPDGMQPAFVLTIVIDLWLSLYSLNIYCHLSQQRMGKPKVRKSSSSSPKKDGKEGEINGEVLTKFFKG